MAEQSTNCIQPPLAQFYNTEYTVCQSQTILTMSKLVQSTYSSLFELWIFQLLGLGVPCEDKFRNMHIKCGMITFIILTESKKKNKKKQKKKKKHAIFLKLAHVETSKNKIYAYTYITELIQSVWIYLYISKQAV